MSSDAAGSGWLFLTSHMHVLLRLARHPSSSARELAAGVGITERHAQRVVAELVEEGYLERMREGRRNRYRVRRDAPLRHASLAALTVGELLDALSRG